MDAECKEMVVSALIDWFPVQRGQSPRNTWLSFLTTVHHSRTCSPTPTSPFFLFLSPFSSPPPPPPSPPPYAIRINFPTHLPSPLVFSAPLPPRPFQFPPQDSWQIAQLLSPPSTFHGRDEQATTDTRFRQRILLLRSLQRRRRQRRRLCRAPRDPEKEDGSQAARPESPPSPRIRNQPCLRKHSHPPTLPRLLFHRIPTSSAQRSPNLYARLDGLHEYVGPGLIFPYQPSIPWKEDQHPFFLVWSSFPVFLLFTESLYFGSLMHLNLLGILLAIFLIKAGICAGFECASPWSWRTWHFSLCVSFTSCTTRKGLRNFLVHLNPPQQAVAGLRFLLQKELRNSDVSQLGRIVLPKVSIYNLNLWIFFLIFHLCRGKTFSFVYVKITERSRGPPSKSDMQGRHCYKHGRLGEPSRLDIQIQVSYTRTSFSLIRLFLILITQFPPPKTNLQNFPE